MDLLKIVLEDLERGTVLSLDDVIPDDHVLGSFVEDNRTRVRGSSRIDVSRRHRVIVEEPIIFGDDALRVADVYDLSLIVLEFGTADREEPVTEVVFGDM